MNLKQAIKMIGTKKGLSRDEIAAKLGYNPSYLSTAANNPTQNLINAVKEQFKEELSGVTIEGGSFETDDAGSVIIENQIEILASSRVTLSILAELQSSLMKDKTLPTQLLGIYRKMVKDEAIQVRDELKQKP